MAHATDDDEKMGDQRTEDEIPGTAEHQLGSSSRWHLTVYCERAPTTLHDTSFSTYLGAS
jgi:hypothetical protein